MHHLVARRLIAEYIRSHGPIPLGDLVYLVDRDYKIGKAEVVKTVSHLLTEEIAVFCDHPYADCVNLTQAGLLAYLEV